jgi:hypothetical protein
MAGKDDAESRKAAGWGGAGSGWLSGGDAETVVYGSGTIHDALQQQIAALLEQADISDEEKQQILVALSCPCCGAGGISLSVKLKDAPPPDKP